MKFIAKIIMILPFLIGKFSYADIITVDSLQVQKLSKSGISIVDIRTKDEWDKPCELFENLQEVDNYFESFGGEALYSDNIDKMALECYKLYPHNINFMLTRPEKGFDQNGRAQDLEESLNIDKEIEEQFDALNIGFVKLNNHLQNAEAAFQHITNSLL